MIGKMLEGVRLSGMNMRLETVRDLVYTGQNSIQVYFTHLIIIFAIMKAVIGNKKIAV
jgi:fucose 4-O-acetylase-like acetyltransferase